MESKSSRELAKKLLMLVSKLRGQHQSSNAWVTSEVQCLGQSPAQQMSAIHWFALIWYVYNSSQFFTERYKETAVGFCPVEYSRF